jgi:hypothetical protein
MPAEGTERIPRTLVIGSDRHQHVTCVSWETIESINLIDFEFIVVNMRSLSDGLIQIYENKEVWKGVRLSLSRLLLSSGAIVLIGERSRTPNPKLGTATNYSWCPAFIMTRQESGTTIEVSENPFPKYHARFKKWDYYYQVIGIHQEFAAMTPGQLVTHPYARNRYGGMLSGTWFIQIQTGQPSGRCVMLPLIEELDQHEAVNLVLEDLLHLPQTVLPPDWLADVPMPIVSDIDIAIAERRATITSLETEIGEHQSIKAALEQWKKLVYASSFELENIFAEALKRCGGKISPAKYSQEEFVLEFNGQVYLVECKGVGKSISLTHVRQLADYVMKYEEDEGRHGKGILLGNPWRDRPIAERGQPDTQVFPANVVARATGLGIALVWSVDFFRVFCRVLTGDIGGNAILEDITGAVGAVDFTDLLG